MAVCGWGAWHEAVFRQFSRFTSEKISRDNSQEGVTNTTSSSAHHNHFQRGGVSQFGILAGWTITAARRHLYYYHYSTTTYYYCHIGIDVGIGQSLLPDLMTVIAIAAAMVSSGYTKEKRFLAFLHHQNHLSFRLRRLHHTR